MNHTSYIEIYEVISKNQLNTKFYKILITPETQYLKQNGSTNTIFNSEIHDIKVLHLFEIPFEKIKPIFHHSKDRILDVQIINKRIRVFGDHNILLLDEPIDFNDNIEKINLAIASSKNFLLKYKLPLF